MNGWIEIRPVPDLPGVSRREAEGFAWRAIVRERLGSDISITYNENGAPVLSRNDGGGSAGDDPVTESSRVIDSDASGLPGYIGVSHTRGWVAVVWSPEPCAIDIELASRRLSSAAAARYSICSISDWCTIEVLYKYKGLTGTDADPSLVIFHPHSDLVVAIIV